MMKKSTKLSPEVLERAVRMVFYARYTERRAEAGVEPSVGSRGDSYDNASAETINGLMRGRSHSLARPLEEHSCRGAATLK